jgi:VanZ family protein
MGRVPRHPRFWLGCFLLWFGVLWILSSSAYVGKIVPPINNFDKVEHFGFFFGGTGLLCAWLFCRQPEKPDWKSLIITAIVVIGVVGMIDEYHQTFTPGRSGNDPYDWMADISGAIVGAFVFKKFHHQLK